MLLPTNVRRLLVVVCGFGLSVLRYVVKESDWKLGFLSLLYTAPLSHSFVTWSSSSPAATSHDPFTCASSSRLSLDTRETQHNQSRKKKVTGTPIRSRQPQNILFLCLRLQPRLYISQKVAVPTGSNIQSTRRVWMLACDTHDQRYRKPHSLTSHRNQTNRLYHRK